MALPSLGGSTNTQVDRNAVSRSATFGIVVADGSAGTFVRFNTLANNLGNAISVSGRGGAARNTLVQGNTISGRGTVGINVSGAVNTAVRGNRITGSSVFGISLALSAGNVVRENTVINSGNVGISLDNARQSIVSLNAVSGSVGDGIVLGARSSNDTVEANNVSGSGSSGISVKENSSNNTFRSNDLRAQWRFRRQGYDHWSRYGRNGKHLDWQRMFNQLARRSLRLGATTPDHAPRLSRRFTCATTPVCRRCPLESRPAHTSASVLEGSARGNAHHTPRRKLPSGTQGMPVIYKIGHL